jgi:hypothetical protein
VRQITKNIPIAQKNIGIEGGLYLNEAKTNKKPYSKVMLKGS